jgi:hypothetical protein
MLGIIDSLSKILAIFFGSNLETHSLFSLEHVEQYIALIININNIRLISI